VALRNFKIQTNMAEITAWLAKIYKEVCLNIIKDGEK
jgi:hypothetical protein